MDFETLWSRYRSGTADGEEISQVEAELEKFRLLEAYIEEKRPPLPPPDAQRLQEELRRARRQVRRRTARVAVGVLAAVLALGVLAQLVLFPAINRRAVKVDWSDTLKAGDPANLPATMQVFTALRIPRANFSGVYAESSGFGTEKLTFLFWDKDGSFSVSGRVTLGILHGLEGDVARLQAAGYRLIGDFSEYTAHLSEEELQARQRVAQQRGRVIQRHHLYAVLLEELPVLARDLEVGLDHLHRADAPETDENLRLHQLHLAAQITAAGLLLRVERVAVLRRTALDAVGDVDARAVEPDHREHIVEELARPADERLALLVLVRARGLAHDDDLGLRRSDAENNVRARLGQRTGMALQTLLLQFLPRIHFSRSSCVFFQCNRIFRA